MLPIITRVIMTILSKWSLCSGQFRCFGSGSISFTHDMGVANAVSRPGYSSYEMYGLDGCFSHMTHEQLVNWVLCAAVYTESTNDQQWLKRNLPIVERCLQSMLNRDHPDESQRNGIMGLDSSRTMGGAEITTYDSLDVSLGQARNNIYLAGKSWAAYLAMEKLFKENDLQELAVTAAIWSWSDQIISGEIAGSKYYPRGVTAILWLEE